MNDLPLAVIVEASRFAILAMAVSLVLSCSRHIDLTLGLPALAGAYGAFVLTGMGHAILGPVLVLALIVVVGGGTGWMLFGRSGRERLAGPVRLLLSLALLLVAENVVSLLIGDAPVILGESTLGTGDILPARASIVIIALVIWLGLIAALRMTRAGRLLRALRSDPALALTAGVPVRALAALFFGVAFGLAGVGGIVTGIDTALTPGFAFRYLLMGIVAAVAGGSNRITGAVVGALSVSVLSAIVTWHIGRQWSEVVVLGVLVPATLTLQAHESGSLRSFVTLRRFASVLRHSIATRNRRVSH